MIQDNDGKDQLDGEKCTQGTTSNDCDSPQAILSATIHQNDRYDWGTLNVCTAPFRGDWVMPVNDIPKNLSIARTCAEIDRVRLSRTATRHAIERSRKSLHETQALLVALRHIYSGDCRRLTPTTAGHSRVKGN
jgi:hypothetical protein